MLIRRFFFYLFNFETVRFFKCVLIFKLENYPVCVSVLLTGMYVHHVCALCLRTSEEGTGFGTEITVESYGVGAGN